MQHGLTSDSDRGYLTFVTRQGNKLCAYNLKCIRPSQVLFLFHFYLRLENLAGRQIKNPLGHSRLIFSMAD